MGGKIPRVICISHLLQLGLDGLFSQSPRYSWLWPLLMTKSNVFVAGLFRFQVLPDLGGISGPRLCSNLDALLRTLSYVYLYVSMCMRICMYLCPVYVEEHAYGQNYSTVMLCLCKQAKAPGIPGVV